MILTHIVAFELLSGASEGGAPAAATGGTYSRTGIGIGVGIGLCLLLMIRVSLG